MTIKDFFNDGDGYILAKYRPEVAKYHLKRTNLVDIKHLIPEFLQKSKLNVRPASIKDLNKLLAGGWLVALAVNSRTLNGQNGYNGHVVVVFEQDEQKYILHNPGLPPQKITSRG